MKLEVGKRYTLRAWQSSHFIELKYVGKEYVVGIDETGIELVFDSDCHWQPYEEEKKEKWYEVLVMMNGVGQLLYTQDNSTLDYYLREWDSKENMINDLKKG